MKRIILGLSIILLLTGCNSNNKPINKKRPIKEENIKEEYIDNNKMPIAFYQDKELIKEYQTNLKSGIDIGIFQIYPSQVQTLSYTGKYADSFYSQWTNIDPNHKIRIGYNLSYSLEDGTSISHNILSVSDTMKYEGYIATYLYDDYENRNSNWYSHLEETDVNDNTFFTSIKLFPQGGIGDVNSKILLTVFTYDTDDDFDEITKEYRGGSKYTITICDKNKTCDK
ncbi:MAG: lipoprotein [Bacilli bacterium]|nr:lipoprotein [Bacilli bacterium]